MARKVFALVISWILASYLAISPLTGISGLYLDHLSNTGMLCVGLGALISRGGWRDTREAWRIGGMFLAAAIVALSIAIGWTEHPLSPNDPYRAILFLVPLVWYGVLEDKDPVWIRTTLLRAGYLGCTVSGFATLVLAEFDPNLGKFKPRVEDWLLGSNHLSFYLVVCVVVPLLLARRLSAKWLPLLLVLPLIHFSKTHLLVYIPIVAGVLLFGRFGRAGVGLFLASAAVSLQALVLAGDRLMELVPSGLERSLGNMAMGLRVAGESIEGGRGVDVLALMGEVGGKTRVVIYQTFFDHWNELWLTGAGDVGAKALFGNKDFHSLYFYLISNYGLPALMGFLAYLLYSVRGIPRTMSGIVLGASLGYALFRVGFITIDPIRFLTAFLFFALASRRLETPDATQQH